MASTNQSPFFQRAEEDFLRATTDSERIACLEIMIKECPKHKSSENMLKNLKTRLKKLKEGEKKKKAQGRHKKSGIKKADMQVVLCGLPNVGKSTLFNQLTKQNPEAKVSEHAFTTYEPLLGTTKFEDTQIQVIDDAPIPNHDKSLINATDTLLLVINQVQDIETMEPYLAKSRAKRVIVLTKIEEQNSQGQRKVEAQLQSRYRDIPAFVLHKNPNNVEIQALKKKIFATFPVIRIYTKEPGKKESHEPMILKEGATVRDAAEKIKKGMAQEVQQTKIWGPSSKFGGQVIGIDHVLKDKDIVEFKT